MAKERRRIYTPPMDQAATIPAAATHAAETRAPEVLDLRGLKCPMPVLRTRRALRGMAVGERILVLSTDPLAAIDIPHFLVGSGHGLDGQDAADGVLRFLVRKGVDP